MYVVLATCLGFAAALGRGKARNLFVGLATMIASAAPVYWIALVLQFFFYYRWHWLPSGGQHAVTGSGPETITGIDWLDCILTLNAGTFWDSLQHLVLPMTAVVLGLLAVGTRLMIGAVEEELDKAYVRTARGKGCPSARSCSSTSCGR